MGHKNIPSEKFRDKSVRACVAAAYGAHESIIEASHDEAEDNKDLTKGDPNVGHHAIVTAGDLVSERYILDTITRSYPGSYFITEEKKAEGYENRIVTQDNLGEILEHLLIFGVDPIDGSSQFERGLYEWSISVGVMRKGEHIGGAIFAPEVKGGLLVAGERSLGTFLFEASGSVKECVIEDRPVKDRLIVFGPDIFFMKQYRKFMVSASEQVRTTNGTGSCALTLALVATGQIDSLVQPVQSPWDWFTGYPLVEEAGGKVIFYHYRDGSPVRIEKPDLLSYSPVQRNVAFIAGSPNTAEWLWEELLRTWEIL